MKPATKHLALTALLAATSVAAQEYPIDRRPLQIRIDPSFQVAPGLFAEPRIAFPGQAPRPSAAEKAATTAASRNVYVIPLHPTGPKPHCPAGFACITGGPR